MKLLNLQILVVEDEPIISMEIADVLSAEGASLVGPASSVAIAMDLIGHAHIDCAILDIDVRGERSFPIADALMKMQIPFAFVTAHTKATVPDDFINRPIAQKPLAGSKLVEIVAQLCASNEH